MEQVGFVTSIKNGKAAIEVKRISGCGGGCKSCSGCDTPSHMVILPNEIDAKVGDMVEIRGESKNILKYMLIVYMVPFSFLIAGIVLGMSILKSKGVSSYEPLSFLIGLVFMAFGYFVVKLVDRKLQKDNKNMITMTKII